MIKRTFAGLAVMLAGAAIIFLTVPVGQSVAKDLEAGIAAYQQEEYEEAIRIWMPLAEAGNPDAQFNVGQLYRMGRGVAQDPLMAEYFYGQAAAQGHVGAQGNLGTLYYFAFDDSPRIGKALDWWHKAARSGDPRSQYMLGVLYYNGDHLPRDPARAYAWIYRAAQSRLPEAMRAESSLIRALSVSQLADGNTLVPLVDELPLRGEREASKTDPVMAGEDIDIELQPLNQPEPRQGGEQAAHSKSGPYAVQLGAVGAPNVAGDMRDRIRERHADLVADHDLAIENSVRDDGGTVYRLFLGGLRNRQAADDLCARFKDAGQDCFVVRRPE